VPRDHRQGSPGTSQLPDEPVSGGKVRCLNEVKTGTVTVRSGAYASPAEANEPQGGQRRLPFARAFLSSKLSRFVCERE
jgi:hypothetical protein